MGSQLPEKNVPEQARPTRMPAYGRSPKELDFEGLYGHLGYFLRDLQVRVFKDFIRTFAVMNVRPAQYSTLVLIAANPGTSQAAIGEALNIERARFARLLHDLERRGWIKRVPAPDDRRSHALFMTNEGRKALAKLRSLAAQHEEQVSHFVGIRDRKILITVLRELKQRDER